MEMEVTFEHPLRFSSPADVLEHAPNYSPDRKMLAMGAMPKLLRQPRRNAHEVMRKGMKTGPGC